MRTLSTAAYQLGAFVVISIFYIASADTAKTAFPGSISTARFPVITPSCTSNTPKVSKLIRPREDPLVAFTDIAGWSILHICAQYCLNNPYEDNIWTFADCQPNESECACLPDSQPIVVRSLSSCLSKTCTSNTADFARATSVYALFCSSVSGAPATTEFPTASGNNIVSVPITIVSTTTLLTSTSSSLSEYRFLLLGFSVRLTSSVIGLGPSLTLKNR